MENIVGFKKGKVCYNSLQGEKTYDINEKIVDYVLLSYTLKVYIICTVEY